MLLDWPIAKSAAMWARRIVQLDILRRAVRARGEERLLEGLAGQTGKPLAPWWTFEDDLDLLRGTYRHGYGNFEAMRNDPELCRSAARLCRC